MTDDLEEYRKMALDLWFNNGGSCTGVTPSETKKVDDVTKEVDPEDEQKKE